MRANQPPDTLRERALPFLEQHEFSRSAELSVLRGGANNRVFRVDDGKRVAVLKQYFQNPNDPRDRYRAEHAFYEFLWKQGIRRTPEPLGWESEQRLGLLSFVEGPKLRPEEVDRQAIGQAAAFVVELNQARNITSPPEMPVASEGCFSLAEHIECVQRRVARLAELEKSTEVDELAVRFVREELEPAWARARDQIASKSGATFEQMLPREERCLSPSDFGFHNALKPADGRLRFFDFEYAGWDDPAKLTCDFFCQPELPAGLEHWQSFIEPLAGVGLGERLAGRAKLLLPAYQVKWCCIMLNDFVRTGQARRDFALGEDAGQRKRTQLEKARQALTRLSL